MHLGARALSAVLFKSVSRNPHFSVLLLVHCTLVIMIITVLYSLVVRIVNKISYFLPNPDPAKLNQARSGWL